MSTIDTSLPLRLTVRVVIKRDDKVCLCKKIKNGVVVDYNVPGGGVEEGDSMEITALKECLEEVGIRVHNVKALGLRLPKHHLMGKPERNAIWSGTDTHYFVADFLRVDKTKYNADGDAVDFDWVTIPEAIRLIKSGPYTEFNAMKIEALEMVMPKEQRSAKPAFLRW